MSTDDQSQTQFMERALELASHAATLGEVPVGCVIVHEGRVVGEGFNTRESQQNPIGHAEINAIIDASRRLRRWRLSECTLFVTLEPCFMCAGAIVNARIPRVVYGALDPKAGAGQSLANVLQDTRLNHRCEVVTGVEAARSSALLKEFFVSRRNK